MGVKRWIIYRSFRKSAILLSLGAMLLGVIPDSVSAQVDYTYQQNESSTKAPEGKPYISGSNMVWSEADNQGYEQIYFQNLNSGVKQPVTTALSHKDLPKVGVGKNGHVYVVWIDRRNYTTGDIYAYDLNDSREWKVNGDIGFFSNFSVSGSDVVTVDSYKRMMFYFDLAQGKESQIGEGRSPVVADGKVLYKNAHDGGLSLRDLQSGAVRKVLELPAHLNVIDVDYNGKYALYKQADLDWQTKYVMLDVSDPNAKPVDLTPAVKKKDEYYQLYMGGSEAAWLQDTGSGPQLLGVNLQRSETHVILPAADTGSIFNFVGDRLVTKSPAGMLSYTTIVRTEGSPLSGGSINGPVGPKVVSKQIGEQGGELAADDGSVRLAIPAGAVKIDTSMSLGLNEARTSELSALPGVGVLKPASKAWDIQLGGELARSASLSFTYETGRWSELQSRKMAVYRWSDASRAWETVGARLDVSKSSVAADILQSGTYALFVNDVSFADVRNHWAQNAIEILAARGIVNGMSDDKYEPDAVLTRAQFTKMLLGALKVKPVAGAKSVFSDVPSSHWSAEWVAAAASRGLIQGYGDSFRPDDQLSREQMIAILVRALGDEGKANALTDEQVRQGLPYADAAELSDWSKRYAALSSQYGLIEGNGQLLEPKQSSTRAQAATVIYRLLDRLKQQ